jgi:hypothetical protein
MTNYVVTLTLSKDGATLKSDEVFSVSLDETNLNYSGAITWLYGEISRVLDRVENSSLWGTILKLVSKITAL